MMHQSIRTIRSFVRRQGRMSNAQINALNTYWQQFGLKVEEEKLDFNRVFGRSLNNVLEIGFGNGDSLLKTALQYPETNFIGIEVHRPGVGSLLQNIAEHQLTNIRIYQQDAIEVLIHSIPMHSLNKVQIFFPDPWPKKRHHKRRLIQPDFITLLHHRLVPGGLLHIATDWQDYADHIIVVMQRQPGWQNLAEDNCYIENRDLRPSTKFELRGQRLGFEIKDILFVTKPLN